MPRERPAAAFDALAGLLGELAAVAPEGVKVAFHPHTATWSRRRTRWPPSPSASPPRAQACARTSVTTVGGGDPVRAIGDFGSLVTHVHMKDVDPAVLERMRAGGFDTFGEAVRERIFTELGNGALDVHGTVCALDRIGFEGWLMVEQDSTSLRPSEAAAVGKRVLEYELREMNR